MTKKVTLGRGKSNGRTSTSGHDGLTGTLSLRPFSKLIIIVLNSWPENSDTHDIFDSGSDVCSVFKLCVLPFRMSCNFLLICRHDVLGGRSYDKQAVSAVVVGHGERREGNPSTVR